MPGPDILAGTTLTRITEDCEQPLSEIRLRRRRNTGVLVGIILSRPRVVMSDVLGADALLPSLVYRRQIRDRRRPRHGEYARVIDRKFQLHPLAFIRRIDVVG